jgi:hypothetical protein
MYPRSDQPPSGRGIHGLLDAAALRIEVIVMANDRQKRRENPFKGGGDAGHANPVEGDARSGRARKGPVQGGSTKQDYEEGDVGQFTGEGQPPNQKR